MSTTGATPEQIAQAWKRRQQRWSEEGLDSLAGSNIIAKQLLIKTAADLVRPDERIVLVDDLEHLLNAWDRHVECVRDGYQCEVWMEERAAADRLRAAIGTSTVDPVCPQCGERTYESPRTGRTCVRNECG